MLSPFGQVFAFDLSPCALQFCQTRRMAVLRASVMALPFEDRSFDLITSFDVLYFKGIDDRVALEESARVLVPGGRMLIRVPAFDWLRGVHDVKVSTHHRYTLKELREKLVETGLKPEFINYANALPSGPLLEDPAPSALVVHDHAVFSYVTLPGLSYVVETSTNLSSWTPANGANGQTANSLVSAYSDSSFAPMKLYRVKAAP